MKRSTTGLLLGSALAIGLSGCATPTTEPSSDRPWYQQPVVCGIAGGLIGGSIGYATSGSSDEERNAARGGTVGAGIGAMLCADRTPEPVAEPEPEPMPEPPPPPAFEPVVLDSAVTFAFDSAKLRPEARPVLDGVADTLREIRGARAHRGPHRLHRLAAVQRRPFPASCRLRQGVPGLPGDRRVAHDDPGLRRSASGRHQRDRRGSRAEPSRGNPQLGLIRVSRSRVRRADRAPQGHLRVPLLRVRTWREWRGFVRLAACRT